VFKIAHYRNEYSGILAAFFVWDRDFGWRSDMREMKESLLIVDDEPLIRTTLSWTLTDCGYSVRTAEDGFSALIEIRKQIPDIILSDLNMPGMSGYEFLSVVRRRFPAVPLIAMSGAFCGDEGPSGSAADAFFQKGCGVRALLKILEGLPRLERLPDSIALARRPS